MRRPLPKKKHPAHVVPRLTDPLLRQRACGRTCLLTAAVLRLQAEVTSGEQLLSAGPAFITHRCFWAKGVDDWPTKPTHKHNSTEAVSPTSADRTIGAG